MTLYEKLIVLFSVVTLALSWRGDVFDAMLTVQREIVVLLTIILLELRRRE